MKKLIALFIISLGTQMALLSNPEILFWLGSKAGIHPSMLYLGTRIAVVMSAALILGFHTKPVETREEQKV